MKRDGRFAQAMERFFQGRYGPDPYTRFLSFFSLGLLILSLCLKSAADGRVSSALFFVALALLVWTYFRTLSRNIPRRQSENERYLAAKARVTGWFAFNRDRFRQRKEYAFFRCPGCKQTVRVPRGKGKIRITCRRCGYTFEKKT